MELFTELLFLRARIKRVMWLAVYRVTHRMLFRKEWAMRLSGRLAKVLVMVESEENRGPGSRVAGDLEIKKGERVYSAVLRVRSREEAIDPSRFVADVEAAFSKACGEGCFGRVLERNALKPHAVEFHPTHRSLWEFNYWGNAGLLSESLQHEIQALEDRL